MTDLIKHLTAGAPTKYKDEYVEQVFKLALLGSTLIEVADFFEVSRQTIIEWQRVHPDFYQSFKDGKVKADSEVAKSLYKRANGYTTYEEKVNVVNGEVVITRIKKEVPPEPKSQAMWLKSRQNEKWGAKAEIDIDDDTGGINIKISYE